MRAFCGVGGLKGLWLPSERLICPRVSFIGRPKPKCTPGRTPVGAVWNVSDSLRLSSWHTLSHSSVLCGLLFSHAISLLLFYYDVQKQNRPGKTANSPRVSGDKKSPRILKTFLVARKREKPGANSPILPFSNKKQKSSAPDGTRTTDPCLHHLP